VPDQLHRCPDCGREFESASALVDHSVAEHVEPPAARIRPVRFPWVGKAVAGIVVLLSLLVWGGLGVAAVGGFDKGDAPETPRSAVHRIAVGLVESGDADDYRAVEPADGWDVEYEIDGDGEIRIRDEGGDEEQIEYAAFSGDLRDAIERAAKREGFEIEE
jgi:hypothetical protein